MKKIPTDNFQFRIVQKDGKKVIELLSRNYYQHFINTKTKIGDIGTMSLTFKKPTRSEAQLRYYAVIVGLIAECTGYDWEEQHEIFMILKFGVKEVKYRGRIIHIRKSISNKAKFPKIKMMELIDFALSEAQELNIKVPTRKELGYLDN